MLFPYLHRLIKTHPGRRTSLPPQRLAIRPSLERLDDRIVPTITIDPTSGVVIHGSLPAGDTSANFDEGTPEPGDVTVTFTTDFDGTITTTVTYGDGSSDTVQVAAVTGANSVTIPHTFLFADDDPSGTPADPFTASVSMDAGANGTADGFATGTVNNVAPTITNTSVSPTPTAEGSAATLNFTFTDPGQQDTWTPVVNWGDGTTETLPVVNPNGSTTHTVQATHVYTDEFTGAAQITVTDDDTGSGAGTADVTVSNAAPTGLAVTIAPTTVNEGDAVTLTVTFTDTSTLDTFAASVNWGDGSSNGLVAVPPGAHSFTLSHVYADENGPGPNSTDTVSVTLVDDDFGSASASTSVVVNEVLPSAPGIATSATRVPEGNTAPAVTLTVTFTDASPTDTFTATVNFGDGTTQSLTLAAGANPHSFTVAHQYADDADTGPTTLETISVNVADDGGATTSSSTSVTVVDTNVLAEATDAGSVPLGVGGTVQVYGDDGDLFYTLHPFGNFPGGIRVAMGDVNGDLVPDIIVTAGSGGGPRVEVISGADGTTILGNFFVYDPGMTFGQYIAAGDVNGDGKADIVVGADQGGGPHVIVIDGTKLVNGGQLPSSSLLASFFAYLPGFRGGVRVAAADVTGDGTADVIVGAGPGGGPHVQVIDATKLNTVQANGQIDPAAVTASFFAFPASYTGGLFVTAADFTGDGKADVVAAQGSCGTPQTPAHVRVFNVAGNGFAPTQLIDFDPFADLASTPNGEPNGVRVTTSDRNDDGVRDLVAATGPGTQSCVRSFDSVTQSILETDFPFDPAFLGGVFVGG